MRETHYHEHLSHGVTQILRENDVKVRKIVQLTAIHVQIQIQIDVDIFINLIISANKTFQPTGCFPFLAFIMESWSLNAIKVKTDFTALSGGQILSWTEVWTLTGPLQNFHCVVFKPFLCSFSVRFRSLCVWL